MSNQQLTKGQPSSLPSLNNSNILKSLNSVHLPPPPSSARSLAFSSSDSIRTKPGHSSSSSNSAMSFSFPSTNRSTPLSASSASYNHMRSLSTPLPTPSDKPSNASIGDPELSPLASYSRTPSSTTAAAFAAAAAAVAAGSKSTTNSSPDCFNTPPPSRSRNKPDNLDASMAMHMMLHPGDLRTPTLGGPRRKYDDSNKENTGFSRSHLMSGPPPKLMSPASSSPVYDNKTADSETLNENTSSSIEDDIPPLVDDGTKPPYSYATLIGIAILRSEDKKLTLSQIYKWINDTFSWYRKSKSGWQNSIRHNLSLNKAFRKQERPKGDPGKGKYWLVEPGFEHQFLKGRINTKRPSSNFSAPSFTNTTTSNSLQYNVISPLDAEKEPSNKRKATDDEDDDRLADKAHYDPEFNEDLILTPLKRSKTAIGLQHFDEANSPTTRKRAFDPTDFPSNDTTNNIFKKKRLNIRDAMSLTDTIPNLNAPPTSWLPFTSDEGSSMTQVQSAIVSIESPVRNSIGSGLMLGKGLTVTPKRTQLGANIPLNNSLSTPNSKFLSPSPFKAYKNLSNSPVGGSSFEFEDIYPYSPIRSSPSKQKFGFYKEEDDLISRACFGSPDKRAAKRRDYFEYSSGAAGFDAEGNVTDVFGVDICQVVKRAVDRKPSSGLGKVPVLKVDKDETDDENTEDEADEPPSMPAQPSKSSTATVLSHVNQQGLKFPVLEYRHRDVEKLLHYDSPIKTQSSVFSPQKILKRD